MGTDDATLIRVVVSRSERDMEEIKPQYVSAYGKTLVKAIKNDCSGDYKHMLIALVGGEE
eukprot:m.69376 g.69376  ORF g.69376 m.69376 type:complete len:60 (+) comp7809_c2_seq1:234-413(+)